MEPLQAAGNIDDDDIGESRLESGEPNASIDLNLVSDHLVKKLE